MLRLSNSLSVFINDIHPTTSEMSLSPMIRIGRSEGEKESAPRNLGWIWLEWRLIEYDMAFNEELSVAIAGMNVRNHLDRNV